MYQNGFIKIEMFTPNLTIGNPMENASEVITLLNHSKASIALFPELTLSGYTAGDLFYEKAFLDDVLKALAHILEKTTYQGVYMIGLPLLVDGILFNVAAIIQQQKILGIVPKKFIPNYKEFYEKRWFHSGNILKSKQINVLNQKVNFGDILFVNDKHDLVLGVEVCQDMWTSYAPSDLMALNGAHLLFNLSASTEHIKKPTTRRNTVMEHSRKQFSGYFYTSSGVTESTTDLVYSNHKIAAVLGEVIGEKDFFNQDVSLVVDVDIDSIKHQRRIDSTYADQKKYYEHDYLISKFLINETTDFFFEEKIDQTPFIPKVNQQEEVILASKIQTEALKTKLKSNPNLKIIIGISGGLDSTLALLTAVRAMKELKRDPKEIIGVTMPAKPTSKRSKNDALDLMEKLQITSMMIPIEKAVNQHLETIEHKEEDITYENTQARIRTLFLMNLANKYNGFVLGTGDMSEIALGWMTFNGDHMSMYNINAGVTKTWVRQLVQYYAENEFKQVKDILTSICQAPISPELKEEQITEETVGSYEINDFILYHYLVNGASKQKIEWLLAKAFNMTIKESFEYVERFFKRFYSQQFKRQSMPEGPKILQVSLSPRGELRLPSDIKRK